MTSIPRFTNGSSGHDAPIHPQTHPKVAANGAEALQYRPT